MTDSEITESLVASVAKIANAIQDGVAAYSQSVAQRPASMVGTAAVDSRPEWANYVVRITSSDWGDELAHRYFEGLLDALDYVRNWAEGGERIVSLETCGGRDGGEIPLRGQSEKAH